MESNLEPRWRAFLVLALGIMVAGPLAARDDSSATAGGIDGQIILGYRSVSVGGSENKYREDIDLRDGPVLFNLNLLIPKEALNGLADEIRLDVKNLGSQPFETMKLGIRKNGAYRFSFDRRESNYFYNDIVSGEGDVPAADPTTFDTRRVREVAELDLFLTEAATLSFGFDTYRRTGSSTDTPNIVSSGLVFDRSVDESLETFRGAFTYAWDKVTLILEERIKDFDNPVSFFASGDPDGPADSDGSFYNTPHSYRGNEHIVRLLARPNERWDIRFSGEIHNLDLDTSLSQRSIRTDDDGDRVAEDTSGEGTVQRDLQLLDLDVTYLLGERLGLVVGLRRFELDQDGRSDRDDSVTSSAWGIETTALDVGAQYVVSEELTVTGGLVLETRDVTSTVVEAEEELSPGESGVSTDNVGLFVDSSWHPSPRLEITGDLDLNSFDDPFTLSSATDRRRVRLRGKYRWEQGLWLSASYGLNNYENTDSGWEADSARGVLRLGYNRKGLDFSAGYSLVSTDRSIEQLLNGETPLDILYAADSDLVDAQLRWRATSQLTVVGSLYFYQNEGTFGVDRQDYRTGVEYVFPHGTLVGVGYRSVDYAQDAFELNDYDAQIVDFSVGYRW